MDQDSLDFDVISGLKLAGIDVVSSEEAGMKRAPDAEQLAFATSLGRVIYTANRADYARLHHEWMANGLHHAGIIIRARQQIGVRWQIRSIILLNQRVRAEAWADRLEYL